MNGHERKDLAVWITSVVGIVAVACTGILALSKNSTEENKIEQTCYEHGGHMEATAHRDSYMTCVGMTK